MLFFFSASFLSSGFCELLSLVPKAILPADVHFRSNAYLFQTLDFRLPGVNCVILFNPVWLTSIAPIQCSTDHSITLECKSQLEVINTLLLSLLPIPLISLFSLSFYISLSLSLSLSLFVALSVCLYLSVFAHLREHLPEVKQRNYHLRPSAHGFQLPIKDDCNFIQRLLYKDMYYNPQW